MFWDKVSGVYDLFENIYNKSVYQATGESVAKYIKNTDRVLECACGTGAISIFIAPVCKNLFVSVYSVGMLAFCGTQRPLVRWSSGRCAV